FFTTKAPNCYADIDYKDNVYIVFGREDAGLPEELLHENKEHSVRIPMINQARSLNLSNSVAIATYEVLRQWDFPELKNFGKLTKYNWD
ncbi:MAG: TrmH family RNA methyltransferase, partial [Oscillospiraceae bacterium]